MFPLRVKLTLLFGPKKQCVERSQLYSSLLFGIFFIQTERLTKRIVMVDIVKVKTCFAFALILY